MIGSIIHIIGCSPQVQYVVDMGFLLKSTIAGIYDPLGEKVGTSIGTCTVQPYADFESLLRSGEQKLVVVICLKDNKLKEKLYASLEPDADFMSCVHPGSHIARTAQLGKGVIINAGAVIQPHAQIGDGCMIHAGVVIEHDCSVGSFANIAPGVILAGGVAIDKRTTIGAGVVIAPGTKIGKDCLVGAGSLVLEDVPDNVVVYGSPALIIKQHTS